MKDQGDFCFKRERWEVFANAAVLMKEANLAWVLGFSFSGYSFNLIHRFLYLYTYELAKEKPKEWFLPSFCYFSRLSYS
jgi:hypothetical protein